MEIQQEQHPDHTLVQVTGRLDTLNAKEFETGLAAVIDTTSSAIVINMAGIEYVASSGLRSLLTAAKRMRGAGRDLAISGLRPHVREVFDISGFSTIFKII